MMIDTPVDIRLWMVNGQHGQIWNKQFWVATTISISLEDLHCAKCSG